MRVTPLYISQSLTVSVKTQAFLLQLEDGNYFIEYPTNKIPHPANFKNERKVRWEKVCDNTFTSLKEMFDTYIELHKTKPFLHAPSFIVGWCRGEGLDVNLI